MQRETAKPTPMTSAEKITVFLRLNKYSGDANISAGARVVEVVEDGPAAGADLESDDIITAIDGKSVTDPGSLSATVRQYSAGSEVELTVVRDGEEFTETLQLGSMS